ncbi:Rrf2 family transcriptional regulator [bacterium]|nr:Rrf2 family transcriptional regulator [bacterium]
MKLPAKIHYAVVIMTDIAIQGQDDRVSADEIARRQGISFQFVASILNALKRAGLLDSARGGTSGGYALTKKPAEISVKEIVCAVGESVDISPSADLEKACLCDKTVREFWKEAEDCINKIMATTTLKDMCGRCLDRST